MVLSDGEDAGDMRRQFLQAWQSYARWGARLRGDPDQDLIRNEDLGAIGRIANAFRALIQAEHTHISDLLKAADQQLAPFSDPFRLPFSGHRWLDLAREREESYSDWLAWLLARMESAQEVLDVFDIDDAEFAKSALNMMPTVLREEPFTTASGERKRLDIVVKFGDRAILLVEVKIRDIELAGGAHNLPIYRGWLEDRVSDSVRRCAVLLLPAPMESPDLEWHVRSWDQVSLNLRLRARECSALSPSGLLLAAMFLSFAGAVEQNVLGYSAAETISAPQTALYLEQFLGRIRS